MFRSKPIRWQRFFVAIVSLAAMANAAFLRAQDGSGLAFLPTDEISPELLLEDDSMLGDENAHEEPRADCCELELATWNGGECVPAACLECCDSGSSPDRIWRPYVELEGRAGSLREVGQGNLFVPLWQDCESLLFADLRGQWTDVQSAEGNWGLAYRKILPSQWIVGAYGFYDLRHTRLGNNFQQATFGAELLNVNWGFRANGYVPDRQVELVPGLNGAFLQGNNIVVRRGEERAYYGVDFEVERLIWHQCGCDNLPSCGLSGLLASLDAEAWAAAGVFHFDNDTPGFENITGPRLRAELRLYDLPMLGNDSRLVASGQYEHDDVRGSVGSGMLTMRIPFGPGGGRSGARLSALDRRMVAPIVRDIDIITNVVAVAEAAKVAHTGLPISNAVVIDANGDLVNGVPAAGANSVVIVDGSAGAFNVGNTVVLQNGQVVMGGGSQLEVIGCNTGTSAMFTGPGVRPTVNGCVPGINVFQIADNTKLQGFNITGGLNGIFGDGVTGFAISHNHISGASGNGVLLQGTVSGKIVGNTASGNGTGFRIGTLSGGSVSDNTASDNTAIGNLTGCGFLIGTLSGGSVSDNTASGNDEGFRIITMNGGSVNGNMASGHADDGFNIINFVGGSVSGNASSGNGSDGFEIGSFVDGVFAGSWTAGGLENNTSTNNTSFGYRVNNRTGGTATGNTASGNGAGNTVP